MRSVFFETFGCQMNVADTDSVAALLYQRGFQRCNTAGQADLIIVNTCSVRQRAENRARVRIETYAAVKRSHQKLWVMGCMAERVGEQLMEEISGVDAVIGAQSVESMQLRIDEYLQDFYDIPALVNSAVSSGVSVFVPIMRGCNNWCSFCVVPIVRGREHAVPLHQLVVQVQQLVSQGTKEITLLGQNVNSYQDGSSDFADCMTKLHEIDGLQRIRFTTSHPKDFTDHLIDRIAQLPKVCHHIHLPVQSGSSAVLKTMNRNYDRTHYLDRIAMIRKKIPQADITTDILIGFPGETEEDYQQTLSLLQEVQFCAAFMFAFSPRPGTAAATLPHQVSSEIKKQRLQQIVEAQTEITKKQYHAMIGKQIKVLITRAHQHDEWMGQDSGCKRVLVHSSVNSIGELLLATVTDSSGMTLLAQRS
ncbi:MAG: tRNA (N6-isopentenyl adenosine(37)-C2)-methylthiotransferase MiaB [Chitinivibrionales bacterium]|nr:tRNA (N6-isopentenyl adenosine(37)-C2)-methylthiotransferase MiaB [Chitinivibrionales bacterium]